MSGVVVDTSVWVDFLNGQPNDTLEQALARGSVFLTPIVVAELISGAANGRDREAVTDLIMDLPIHETPLGHWIRVGELRHRLRSKGLSVSTPDAHVVQCALDLDAVLLSSDRIFGRIVQHVPLKLGV